MKTFPGTGLHLQHVLTIQIQFGIFSWKPSQILMSAQSACTRLANQPSPQRKFNFRKGLPPPSIHPSLREIKSGYGSGQ